jgi:hypothetical protein
MRPTSRSRAPELGHAGADRRSPGRARARIALLLTAVAGSALTGLTVGNAASLGVNSANLTSFYSCTLSGSSGSTTSMFDTYVDQFSATSNFGTSTTVYTQSQNNKNRRIYIKFDLTKCSPTIPSSATVVVATLKVWATVLPSTCRTNDVFAVTASWTQSGITWNNQPFGTSTNNPASGSRTDGQTVGTASCTFTAVGYVSWTVTSDVAKFVAGTSTNNGWMIRDDAEQGGSSAVTVTYSSSHAGSVPHAPQLIVVYKK